MIRKKNKAVRLQEAKGQGDEKTEPRQSAAARPSHVPNSNAVKSQCNRLGTIPTAAVSCKTMVTVEMIR